MQEGDFIAIVLNYLCRLILWKIIRQLFILSISHLAGSDILHTHINTGVLGASRAEDHMTRCAIKDVYELNMNTQAPALVCDPLSQV